MPEQQLDANTPTTDPSAGEGRIHERHDCELPGSCRPASSWNQPESRWCGTITNISLSGVRLRLPRRFEPGAGLAIELPGEGGEEVFARVVHARPAGDGSWDLGCKFVSELSEDEFHRLLYTPPTLASFARHESPTERVPPVAPSRFVAEEAVAPDPIPTPPTSADQRCHDRHQPIESNVLRLAIRPTFGGRPALLLDVSAGGVGFLLDRPLEPEDVLAIELGGGDGGGTPRLAQVRHCRPCPVPADAPWLAPARPLAKLCRWFFGLGTPRPEGRAWVIGGRFIRPLAGEELKGLLGLYRPDCGRG
jgi:hypothetical protein